MVRDILYPRDTKFKFYRDALIFVGLMAAFTLVGFAMSLPAMIALGTTNAKLVDKSLDLITITVPPALPATMSVGVAFAIQRLKKSKIFCISPPRVNISGRIQIMVFDKTGTLTEDSLEMQGLRAVTGKLACDPESESPAFSDFEPSIKNLISM